MKRCWIEFVAKRPSLPMTFWVHTAIGDFNYWSDATEFNPPIRPVPGKGYPIFCVEYNGFIFQFASLDEMKECIEVLGEKLLPTTTELSAKRTSLVGPNKHWLSRLPSKVKSWKYRSGAILYLRDALKQFEKELSS